MNFARGEGSSSLDALGDWRGPDDPDPDPCSQNVRTSCEDHPASYGAYNPALNGYY